MKRRALAVVIGLALLILSVSAVKVSTDDQSESEFVVLDCADPAYPIAPGSGSSCIVPNDGYAQDSVARLYDPRKSFIEFSAPCV